MNITELADKDKTLDFKVLDIPGEIVDDITKTYGFTSGDKMMESGVFMLHVFSMAIKDGMTKAYFSRPNSEGKMEYFEFDFLKLISEIKNNQNNTALGAKLTTDK